MAIEFIWQLPTGGDGRHGDATQTRRGERSGLTRPPFTEGVSDPRGERFNFLDHLHQIARAADLAGFDGIQIQHDPQGDESWIVAGYLARGSRRLKLLTEFEASRGSAVYAAKNAASFQRFTQGRFAWQISPGGDAALRRQQGDHAPDSDILPRIGEFVEVAKGVLTQSPYRFKGRFFEVLDGGFNGPLSNNPVPPVYLSGGSPEAYALSAQWADVHVLDAAPVDELKETIAKLEALAAGQGRSLAFGLRIDVLARETESEAVRDAQRFLAQSGRAVGSSDPVVAPGLWAGFATERTGAAASLVGSYGTVAERLVKYAEAGVSSFILAAIPHLEEAYRIGEQVLPVVRSRIATRLSKAA
ncbi:alkanesulfonate monooxygenase [Myxococcaceae bacterium]|nr:alkanesulfonate monooxygenase [Myxococcaceae bacterium]